VYRVAEASDCLSRESLLYSAGMSGSYSVPELDRIVSDIFELKKGGSACAAILPEEEVRVAEICFESAIESAAVPMPRKKQIFRDK
jgi:hypothetical protein